LRVLRQKYRPNIIFWAVTAFETYHPTFPKYNADRLMLPPLCMAIKPFDCKFPCGSDPDFPSRTDGVDAPSDGIAMCQCDISRGHIKEGASMEEVTIVGLDLAKRFFQLHGANADGGVAFRRKLSRGQLLAFFAGLPRCIVAMGASAPAKDTSVLLGDPL
jgi:hypothetical protein